MTCLFQWRILCASTYKSTLFFKSLHIIYHSPNIDMQIMGMSDQNCSCFLHPFIDPNCLKFFKGPDLGYCLWQFEEYRKLSPTLFQGLPQITPALKPEHFNLHFFILCYHLPTGSFSKIQRNWGSGRGGDKTLFRVPMPWIWEGFTKCRDNSHMRYCCYSCIALSK